MSRADAYTPSARQQQSTQYDSPMKIVYPKDSSTPKKTNAAPNDRIKNPAPWKRASPFREGSFSQGTSQESTKQNGSVFPSRWGIELLRQQYDDLQIRYNRLEQQLNELNDLHNYRVGDEWTSDG